MPMFMRWRLASVLSCAMVVILTAADIVSVFDCLEMYPFRGGVGEDAGG